MLIIDFSASGMLKEILVSTNDYIVYDYIVYRKFIYEFLISELNHMQNLKKLILSRYA